MDVAGIRRGLGRAGGLTASDIGNGPTVDGTGSVTNHGRGLVTIMVLGSMIPNTVGYGCREPNGRPLGSSGVKAAITSAGRLADQEGSLWSCHGSRSSISITSM